MQSQLYLANDREYVSKEEFDEIYGLADATRRKVGGIFQYLLNRDGRKGMDGLDV